MGPKSAPGLSVALHGKRVRAIGVHNPLGVEWLRAQHCESPLLELLGVRRSQAQLRLGPALMNAGTDWWEFDVQGDSSGRVRLHHADGVVTSVEAYWFDPDEGFSPWANLLLESMLAEKSGKTQP